MDISFECSTCSSKSGNQFREIIDFEKSAYDDLVEWSDLCSGIPQENEYNWWLRSQVLPKVGDLRVVSVSHPFSEKAGSDFWTLYYPEKAAANGWVCHPEDIDRSAFIRCRITKPLFVGKCGAWIQVEVLERIVLTDIDEKLDLKVETFPIIKNTYQFGNFRKIEYKDWMYFYGDGQGDLGSWILIKKVSDKYLLVAFGEWSFHQNCAYFGNILLPKETLITLNSWCSDA